MYLRLYLIQTSNTYLIQGILRNARRLLPVTYDFQKLKTIVFFNIVAIYNMVGIVFFNILLAVFLSTIVFFNIVATPKKSTNILNFRRSFVAFLVHLENIFSILVVISVKLWYNEHCASS